ncbi:MAG: choice-of-anchor D domain-containing protein [candidate division WOR-3 bacterium]
MKKFTFLLTTFIGFIYSQGVINAIPAPVNASGLAWDGSYLWCGAYGVNGDTIYKLNPVDGTILKKIRWRQNADCYGLAFDQGNLWVSDHLTGTDSVYLIDTINGTRVNAIPAHKEYMAGLANDGVNLWHCVYYSPDGRVYKIQKNNGSALDSIDIPSLPQPWGATWDGLYLWVCNDGNYGGTHRIYKIDVITKQIIDSLDSPGNRPWGLAWDGNYLWVIARGSSSTGFVAYQIDLQGGGTPDIQITPTSYNFGFVPLDSTFSFTLNIANIGSGLLTLDSIWSLNPVFFISPLSFPLNLAPDSDTNITVYFQPDTNVYYSSNLVILSNDPVNETTLVFLEGRGVFAQPFLNPSETSHNFDLVRKNCVKDFYLQIINGGYPPLIIDSIIFSDFRFFSGRETYPVVVPCLDTAEVQTITRATGSGSYNGTASIFSNDPSSPTLIQLSASIDTTLPQGGDLLWMYNFPDNVVCVADIGDINGDGIHDVAAESYNAGGETVQHLNVFWGNSSNQGVLRWKFGDDTTSGSWGDDCLILGDDYNNDGISDIILGTAWGDRSVYTIDGATGQVIWRYDTHWYDGEGGWVYSVKPMPDINGDNIGEVLAGVGGNNTPAGGPRSIYCFSGATGDIIWRFRAQDAIGSVNWINDVNGDGIVDAICGAWGNSLDRRVYCISGGSSGVVYTPLWSYYCGGDVMSVISIPDVSGDNIPDVIAGTWSDSVFCLSGLSGSRIWARYVGGLVIKVVAIPDLIANNIPGIGVASLGSTFYVLNSLNGNVFWTYPANSNVWTTDAISDIDGDGKFDILFGNQTPGIVYCLSGVDGDLIWSYNEGKLIYSIRAVGDISFDGYPDVVVGTQSTNGVAHLLALCGGAPSGAVKEKDVLHKSTISVLPRVSSNSFYISFDTEAVRELKIYDVLGRLIKGYEDLKGTKGVVWKGMDNQGRKAGPGIYFVRIIGDNINSTEKIILVR